MVEILTNRWEYNCLNCVVCVCVSAGTTSCNGSIVIVVEAHKKEE